jgi:outer membrane protein OmpA-like peptidoglycan-associated protein
MKCGAALFVQRVIPVALVCAFALLSGGNAARAQSQPSEAQILDALKARGPARGAHESAALREQDSDERQFLEELRRKNPRTITVDDRKRVAEIASQHPSIDLEVTFDYNSAVISPQAVPVLVKLGRALASSDLKGATFLINGHTDAAGNDSYNLALSERRAEAVKLYLAQHFNLPPDQLFAVGFGRSQLKNAADPLAAENRRVQIVNAGQ